MRAFFMVALMALLIGAPVASAAAHDGWFVRVCSAKTRSGSHSLGVLRRPAGIQLVLDQGPEPRRNRPPPPVSRHGAPHHAWQHGLDAH